MINRFVSALGAHFTVLLLLAGTFASVAILIWIRHFFPQDKELFGVVSALATGFSGSFFTTLRSSGGQ